MTTRLFPWPGGGRPGGNRSTAFRWAKVWSLLECGHSLEQAARIPRHAVGPCVEVLNRELDAYFAVESTSRT